MSHTHTGPPQRIRAVFFDFMGTCLDWHTAVVKAMPAVIPEGVRSRMALDWRQEFFSELHSRSEQGLDPEDIDVTHRRTLLRVLRRGPHCSYHHHFVEESSEPLSSREYKKPYGPVERAVESWHQMEAWPDVLPALTALTALREQLDVETFVLANGTTRLQLDLAKSSGLASSFHLLFSSEMLGHYKPRWEA
ncbi:hypothetical protein F5Y18DRAFT_380508 [Xylariaceae sp. FL1019]|nr:hypothetical protein F5Y18DRAFT_380508 [Xylariaceae sp. FL1019]